MAFSFASSFNTKKLFNVDTSDYEYKKLEELWNDNSEIVEDEEVCNKVFPVLGLYLNKKSMFEPQPVVATDECYVNLPAGMFDSALEILSDPRAIQAINAGKVGFQIEKYFQKRYQKECYSVHWVDM